MILISELEKQLRENFYWFHAHPELSYEEYETTKRIKEILAAANVEILNLPLETGLVAVIRGRKPGPTIALRCDIDALPVQEETDLPYCSTYTNKMHACGHDFHTTAVIGTALLLKEREEELAGTVKFLFQPAEESSLGALKIVETGTLEDISAIFGIHVCSLYPVGTLGIGKGSITAAVDRFSLTIKGMGTHAAHPHEGNDPIPAAASFISAAQTIVSRSLSPFDNGLVSITHIEGGSTWNVIPESVFLEGTVRTLGKELRQHIEKKLRQIAEHTALTYGAEADFQWIPGPPATDNDPFWAEFAAREALAQDLKVETPEPSLGGEDFAFYQEQIPGAFIQIGTGESYPNHHPKFAVDPDALPIAAKYCEKLLIKALQHLEGE